MIISSRTATLRVVALVEVMVYGVFIHRQFVVANVIRCDEACADRVDHGLEFPIDADHVDADRVGMEVVA